MDLKIPSTPPKDFSGQKSLPLLGIHFFCFSQIWLKYRFLDPCPPPGPIKSLTRGVQSRDREKCLVQTPGSGVLSGLGPSVPHEIALSDPKQLWHPVGGRCVCDTKNIGGIFCSFFFFFFLHFTENIVLAFWIETGVYVGRSHHTSAGTSPWPPLC